MFVCRVGIRTVRSNEGLRPWKGMSKTIKDMFSEQRQAWLDDARAAARKLLRRRYCITIEHVLEVCPLPEFLHRNTIGSVFKHDDFMPVGWVKSRRPVMNGRFVRSWRLKHKEEI